MERVMVLAINPGSTSTKIAIYSSRDEIFSKTITHSSEELENLLEYDDEIGFRKEVIEKTLKEADFKLEELGAVVGRGGLLRPLSGGTYLVNNKMLKDLKSEKYGKHASNFGGCIARELGEKLNIKSYIVDPVVVDELSNKARISGMNGVERRSIFHALNQKAVARRYSQEIGRPYEELNLIVAHLGGGISVGAHQKGKVVDVNNALDGEGPFSPERSGGVPIGDLLRFYEEKGEDLKKFGRRIKGEGGVKSYLDTIDMRKVVEMAKEDSKVDEILEAMIYQLGKEIGGLVPVFNGKVDSVILTGGIAYSKEIMDRLKEYINYIGTITIYPGEDEMRSLVEGVLRVVDGKEKPLEY